MQLVRTDEGCGTIVPGTRYAVKLSGSLMHRNYSSGLHWACEFWGGIPIRVLSRE